MCKLLAPLGGHSAGETAKVYRPLGLPGSPNLQLLSHSRGIPAKWAITALHLYCPTVEKFGNLGFHSPPVATGINSQYP